MALKVGEKVSGKVSGITNFGAFVDLGDHQTGLVHISEVSDEYVKDINDVLSVGDEVTVKVTKIADDGKIALSIRKAGDYPQEEKKPSYQKTPQHRGHSTDNHHANHHGPRREENFDDLLSNFMKESESRMHDIKKNTEGKRGGRGGRRS